MRMVVEMTKFIIHEIVKNLKFLSGILPILDKYSSIELRPSLLEVFVLRQDTCSLAGLTYS